MADFADGSANFTTLTAAQLAEGFAKCGNNGIRMTSSGFNSVVRYLEDLIAGGPDKFVTGLASYNDVTNILLLNMSDGSTVPVDMTALIADALDDIPEKFLASVGPYNAATNILPFTLNDGTVINFDTTALLADVPDTAKTVRGLVNLVDLQQMGDGRKVFDVNVEVGNTENHDVTSVGVGHRAGESNAGASVVAVGYAAGLANTANYLVAVGHSAGLNNSGEHVTSAGHRAGENNAGVSVVAVGRAAGLSNTANYLVAVGDSAGLNNTGSHLTTVGAFAGENNTGVDVTAIGRQAGHGNTGNNVTTTGAYAGRNNSGASLTAFGHSAAQNNTFANVVALGHNSAPTADNQVMLGNLTTTDVRTAGAYFGTAFNVVSDARNKENVTAINADKAVEFASGLRWVEYDLLSDFHTVDFTNKLMQDAFDKASDEYKKASAEYLKLKKEYDKALAAFEKGDDPDALAPVEPTEPVAPEKPTAIERRVIGRRAGLVAQEVQELTKSLGAFEYVVNEGPGGSLSIDYQMIDAIVNKAVQHTVFGAKK
jgi:hypothetical protein